MASASPRAAGWLANKKRSGKGTLNTHCRIGTSGIHENINRDFSALIDLTELFEHPTIAKLALHLQSKLGSTAA